MQSFYLIQFVFISYFGNTIGHTDIYLFFTHITETFESIFFLYEIVFYPLFIVVATSFIIMFVGYEKSKIPTLVLFLFLLSSLLFQDKMHDASLSLIKEGMKSIFLKKEAYNIQKSSTVEKTPISKTDNNIVLVIGESMRSRENLKERYDIFENYGYKTILSGATNTDVAVPLLINGGLSPQKIDLQNNLFLLAKKNGYKTSFVSAQNEKSLKYIEPYLHKKHIDNFKILGSRDDKELISHLKNISLKEKNFIERLFRLIHLKKYFLKVG